MPPGLLKLGATNFLSLKQVDVTLDRLNVLVGPNASGKSNLLTLIQFLGDCVREDLQPALDRRGGYERVRFRGETKGQVSIRVEANVTKYSSLNARDEYELTIAPYKAGTRRLLRRRETFRFKRYAGRGRRITIDGDAFEVVNVSRAGETEEQRSVGLRQDTLGLATLPKLSAEEGGEEVRRVADLFATFRIFDVNVAAARLPSAVSDAAALNADASNLAAFLARLMDDDDICQRLEEDARQFIPGLRAIKIRTIGGATEAKTILLEEHGLRGETSLSEASFGTIRALALLAVLYDPKPPILTCIEEIDHGLHPYVFDRLADLLRIASSRTQFIIATHSPAFVNRLSAPELIVCERDPNGASRIPAVDASMVRRAAEAVGGELGLGELWFSGSLGGVPRF